MDKSVNLPNKPQQLKKWQLALLGLLQPSNKVLNILFPPGLPYTKLARSVIRYSFSRLHHTVIKRLIDNGYILKDKAGYRLTVQGRKYSNKLLSWYIDRNPARWDGKWRIVIYDVPEIRKKDRDYLRRLLIQHGFSLLQASVWISPYPVPRSFNQQLWNMKIKYHVLYLLVNEIDYDKKLRKLFPELVGS